MEARPKSSSNPAPGWHRRGKSAKSFYKSNKELEQELMIQSVRQSVVPVVKDQDQKDRYEVLTET